MPDISMCNNEECPLKRSCYRYMAEPDDWQSYIRGKYENGECKDFLDIPTSRRREP